MCFSEVVVNNQTLVYINKLTCVYIYVVNLHKLKGLNFDDFSFDLPLAKMGNLVFS